MAVQKKVLFLICLVVMLECISSQPNGRGRGRGPPPGRGPNNKMNRGKQKFFTNNRFNAEKLLSVIRDERPGDDTLSNFRSNQQKARVAFSEGDDSVKKDEAEQTHRQVLGDKINNEFLDSEAAVSQAVDLQAKTEKLTEVTGVGAEDVFDADNNVLDSDIAETSVKNAEKIVCVFDKSNTEPCDKKFREPTGRCSNVEMGKKTWGMAGTPFTRLLQPKYEDGVEEYRVTEFNSHKPLKSARAISRLVTSFSVVLNSDGPSAMIMQWGQFIAHEFTLIGEIEKNVACCPDRTLREESGNPSLEPTPEQLEAERKRLKSLRGDVCIPIENENDNDGKYLCMEHTRSKISPPHDCSLGPRQQMNLITHVFDASNVYGSSEKEASNLRSFQQGKMKVQEVNGETLPPPNRDNCQREAANRCPFLGGDVRINTTPNLIATHTMFLVVHNKIAEELLGINKHWDDERVYQETRRIVSAIQANIHYYEYLPLVVGPDVLKKFNLDKYTGFDPNVNPSILNELAGAAMRYGHSLIDGFVSMINDQGRNNPSPLDPLFFNSTFVYEGGYKQCIRGMIADRPWRSDRFFTAPIRENLFRSKRDLVSLNINRGRDHGFASYMDYRRLYNLPVASTFQDMSSTHEQATVDGLQQAYTSVEDIELYIGGVTEKPNKGLTGDLFANIIADGFSRTQRGDRHYFENIGTSGLTQEQVDAIKNYKWSNLICDGSEINVVPKDSFKRVSSNNPEVACSSLPKLNLKLWTDIPDDNGGACDWEVIERGKCCKNKRKVKRECKGESNTCQCKGDAVIEEDCSCDPYDYKCQIENQVCSYNKYTSSWNRFKIDYGNRYKFNTNNFRNQLEGLLSKVNKGWRG